MPEMRPRIDRVKFRHSNWSEGTAACVLEPNFEPLAERDDDSVEGGWALNLMVGVNGSGKTTLLKCIEMACEENRPLHGEALSRFIERLASLGVEYFEIAVSFEAEMFAQGVLVNIAWEFYADWFLEEFRKLGGNFTDEEQEYDACMDWFHEESDLYDHFCIKDQDRLTLNFVTKFDVKNKSAELEIIPEIYYPQYVGFEIDSGGLKKTDKGSMITESIFFPSVIKHGEALYPLCDAQELYSQVHENMKITGLPFMITSDEYPANYPKVLRIQSKSSFEIASEQKEGLCLIHDVEHLKMKIDEMTNFEIEQKFGIKRNQYKINAGDKNKVDVGEVYCFDGVNRVEPLTFQELISVNGSFLDDTIDMSEFRYDKTTGTKYSSYSGGGGQSVIYNPDKKQLINHIRGTFCEKPGSGNVIVGKLYGISEHTLEALEVVSRFSQTYISGGYLTDGQARIASLVYEILTQEYDILLIDEPETSMHIDWQRRIVGLIAEESKYRMVPAEKKDLDETWSAFSHIYITTHSPDVILNHLEFVTELAPQQSDVYQP